MAAPGNAGAAALALVLLCALCVQGAYGSCTGSPPNPPNGVFNCSDPVPAGSRCRAKCNPSFVGSVVSICLPNGQWGPAVGLCAATSCSGSPPNPANGAFDCGASSSIGRRCEATCNAGYAGAPSSFCLSLGVWSPVAGTCVKLPTTTAPECSGSPPNPANGAFDCGATSCMGTKCQATCDAGFAGKAVAFCLPTGEWGPVIGACF